MEPSDGEDGPRKGALWVFLLSQFVSLIGDRVATLAYVSLAARAVQEHAGAAAANVAAVQIAPILLFSYSGGWLSDRISRKWLMWWIDVGRFAIVALFVVAYRGRELWPVYTVVLLLGTLSALFNPAKRSLIPFLVPRGEIAWANWWVANSEIVAMLAGIAAGTALLSVISPQHALILDSASFAVALLILLGVPNVLPGGRRPSAAPLLEQLREGLRLTRNDATVRGLLLRLNLPFFVAAGLFYASATHWAAAREPDNAGASLGRLLLALAVGALCAFPLRHRAAVLGERRGTAVIFALGAVVIAILAVTANLTFVGVAIPTFLCGITVGLLYVRSNYLLHLHAPQRALGRLVSLREVLGGGAFAGTVAAMGALGDRFNAGRGWLGAALVFALGSLAMFRFTSGALERS